MMTSLHPNKKQSKFKRLDLNKVIQATGAVRHNNGSETYWMGHCPSHDDKNPSLKITGEPHGAKVHCFAKCDWKAIREALLSRGCAAFSVDDLDEAARDTNKKTTQADDKWELVSPIPDNAPSPLKKYKDYTKPKKAWKYFDEEERPLFYVVRFNHGDGVKGKDVVPQTLWRNKATGALEWRWKGFPGIQPLYNLHLLTAHPDRPVVVVEGEKSADAAVKLFPNCVVTTSPGGCLAPGKADWMPLRGRDVIVWPDADQPNEQGIIPGLEYRDAVARLAHEAGAVSVKILPILDGVKDHWDAADALAEGWTPERAADYLKTAQPWTPPPADTASTGAADNAPADDEDTGEKEPKPTVAAILIRLAQDAELFHTPDDRGAVTFPVRGHRETAYIKSTAFRRWLRHRYYTEIKKPPNSEGMQQAIETLESIAVFEGQQHAVYIRTAASGGSIYIDLGNENWEAVQCTLNGWDIIAHPPVKFIRPSGMLPLPAPEKGNALYLRRFINVKQESDLQLILSWLINSYRPDYPFPVLVLLGEQGSAKSTASRILRSLIDPNDTPIRSAPREERDLYVSAKAGWVMVFDNLSGLSNHLSDALCRLSTGGGFAVRELYSDSEEIRFNAMRPVILNGITDVVTRPDLLDRSLIITLEPIPEDQRKTEEEIWTAFDPAASAIFGGLLDAVCAGLRNVESVHLERSPRMADFARFATAMEIGLGFQAGDFMKAYTDNRKDAISTSLDVDPLAQAIREMVDGEEWFEGTAAELLEHLETMSVVTNRIKCSRTWPQSARGLRSALKRIRPLLAGTGIMIEFSKIKRNGHHPIRVTRFYGETTSPTSPTSPDSTQSLDSIDDTFGDVVGDVETPTSPTSPNIPSDIPHHKHNEINQLGQDGGTLGTLGTLHPPIIGEPVEIEI